MNYDIIYFTLFRTDHAYSSVSLSFSREFVKHNRVFYINHPYSLKDFWEFRDEPMVRERASFLLKNKVRYEKMEGMPDNFVSVMPPLTIPINWLDEGATYHAFWKRNNNVVLDAIRQTIKDYNIKNFIYLNCYNPFYAGYLPKDFGQALSIYQCIDDITQDPYTIKHGKRLEDEAVQNSDIAVVTSSELLKNRLKFNPKTYLLPNAVDISIFESVFSEKHPRPTELVGAKGRIISQIGNLDNLRVNYPLLKQIAERHPNDTLLLIGPINNTEYKEIGLDKLPNVIFTGSKKIQELPQYLQYIDCTIIPYLCNTLTKSIYPLKINEYLAAGRPVVSSRFSEDIAGFYPHIYLAKNDEEFIQLIDHAIAENSPQRVQERVRVANENSWTARVKRFWEIVAENVPAPQ